MVGWPGKGEGGFWQCQLRTRGPEGQDSVTEPRDKDQGVGVGVTGHTSCAFQSLPPLSCMSL